MEYINLKTRNTADRVVLRGVRVHTILAGMSQKTVVEQTFINREPRAIEAVYTFPLPDGAAVCGFEVVTGDRVLTGTIEETDAAIEKYDTAIAAGDAAYLAEQERPDVFSIRVGNIKPRQAALVRLTYVCQLDVNDNQIRLAFPTTLAPRFAADTGTDPLDAAIDGDALNPPHVLSVPYGLTFTAEIRLGRKIKSIASPSHSISVADDDDGYQLALTGTAAMDRELVLNIELAREFGPCVQVESGKDNQSFLAISFVPEFDSQPRQPAATETIFVLDCSGSMEGPSITQAVAALELCLRSLNEGDTFNICKFGSNYELMNPEPVVYSQATLDAAIQYISRGNSLGGTELFEPLQKVMTIPPAKTVVRSVILLTDGQVTNEPALLAMARRHRGRNRIFSFGIGPACSSFLVKGLARVTGGAAEFITAGEKIHEKVLRTFARLSSPLASDVQIDWDGTEAQTLAELPPVFDGEVLTVFARVLGRRPRQITLKCQTDAGERNWKVAVPKYELTTGGIATMWARRTIQSLEEVNGITRTAVLAKGSRERDQVIQLSKEFGLLSSLTTFIAVEHRSIEERNAGNPATQRVPVMVPDGWGGIDLCMTGGGSAAACAPAMPSVSAKRRGGRLLGRFFGGGGAAAGGMQSRSMPPQPAPQAKIARLRDSIGTPPDAVSDSGAGLLDLSRESDEAFLGADLMDEILSKDKAISVGDLEWILMQQSAAGDFGFDARIDTLAASIPNWKDLSARAKAWSPTGSGDRQKIFDTARVLLVLMSKFAADEPLWKRAAEKAARYLVSVVGKDSADVTAQLRAMM